MSAYDTTTAAAAAARLQAHAERAHNFPSPLQSQLIVYCSKCVGARCQLRCIALIEHTAVSESETEQGVTHLIDSLLPRWVKLFELPPNFAAAALGATSFIDAMLLKKEEEEAPI